MLGSMALKTESFRQTVHHQLLYGHPCTVVNEHSTHQRQIGRLSYK